MKSIIEGLIPNKITGFIHSHHGEPSDATIPVFENLLYVLALMRTHNLSNIQKATDILKRLLHFQLEDGSFPKYIHEFPVCDKPLSNIHYLAPLHLLDKYYGKVLIVKDAYLKLISFIKTQHLPHTYQCRLAACTGALNIDNVLSAPLASSTELFEHLVTLSLLDANSPGLKNALEYFSRYYSKTHSSYIGPHTSETTSQNLFSSVMRGELTDLKTALIFPHIQFIEETFEQFDSCGYQMENHKDFCYSLSKSFVNIEHRPSHLLDLHVKDTCLQLNPSSFDMTSARTQEGISLQVVLPALEHSETLVVFTTKRSTIALVNREKASAFSLKDTLTLGDVQLQFQAESAKIRGHIWYPSDTEMAIGLRVVRALNPIELTINICFSPENQLQDPLHADHYQHIE